MTHPVQALALNFDTPEAECPFTGYDPPRGTGLPPICSGWGERQPCGCWSGERGPVCLKHRLKREGIR